jgi:hypothetical protein
MQQAWVGDAGRSLQSAPKLQRLFKSFSGNLILDVYFDIFGDEMMLI